jgi:hypothetical protein
MATKILTLFLESNIFTEKSTHRSGFRQDQLKEEELIYEGCEGGGDD